MTPAELNRLLDEAFEKWVAVVGLDLDATSWTIRMDGRGSYELRKQAEDLQEARALDPSGLTCFMLLKVFVEHYIEQETVTALDLIRGLSAEQQARIDSLRDLRQFLELPEVQAYVDEFVGSVRAATAHYGIDHGDLDAWLTSPYWMAVLRRDALRSMERLEAHQFCWGEPASGKTQYGQQVMEFWNIPSLIRAMQAQGIKGIPGINLCLIRDPEGALHSFFVLAVVNGESVTVLTDREKTPHPDSKRMSRRPDRTLDRRASQHWFPYELLGLEVSKDGKRLFEKARTGLVPVNAQAAALTEFGKLHPTSAIWLALLFGLIDRTFFQENKRLPALSYTAEMVRVPHLLAGAESALVKSGNYRPLEAPDLILDDLRTKAMEAEQGWECPNGYANQWMLDRYAAEVPAEVFNLVGEHERLALPGCAERRTAIEDDEDWEWRSRGKRHTELPYPAHVQTEGQKALWEMGFRGKDLHTMDPISFGTAEQMHRDRKWVARRNLCKVVQRLAEREHEETVRSLIHVPRQRDDAPPGGWIWDRIQERREWIIETLIRGEWMVQSHYGWKLSDGTYDLRDVAHPEPQPVNLVRWGLGKSQNWPSADYWSAGECLLGRRLPRPDIRLSEYSGSASRWLCAVDGALATYHAVITPSCARDLAVIFGVPFEELPWQLKVWVRRQPDWRGNHILNRMDPAEWALRNPWCGGAWGGGEGGLPLVIGASFSRKTVNQVRKKLGLPKFDWNARNPEEVD